MDGAEKGDDLYRLERDPEMEKVWQSYNCAISNLQRFNDMQKDFGVGRVYKQAGTVYIGVINVVRKVDCRERSSHVGQHAG